MSNSVPLKLNVMSVKQQENVFYIGKIKASQLLSIATLKWRGNEGSYKNKYIEEVKSKFKGEFSEDGIQRVLELNRLQKLANYIKDDGIFPSSLIVSINNKLSVNEEGIEEKEEGYEIEEQDNGPGTLYINPDKVNAFIVDGQHRLAAFSEAEGEIEDYELVVTFFLDLEVPLQAEIFATINGNQKPVNKSLLYDLEAFKGENDYNLIKTCHGIVKKLNIEPYSPFNGEIKMLGTGYGSISQSAFIDELIKYLKDRRINKHKSFLRNKESKEIIKILLSYFLAVKEQFPEQWNNSKESVLLKTTGFGALMKLLYSVYIYFDLHNKEFKKADIKEFFKDIDQNYFSRESWGGSGGQGLQNKLYKKLVVELFGDMEEVEKLDKKYKEKVNF